MREDDTNMKTKMWLSGLSGTFRSDGVDWELSAANINGRLAGTESDDLWAFSESNAYHFDGVEWTLPHTIWNPAAGDPHGEPGGDLIALISGGIARYD